MSISAVGSFLAMRRNGPPPTAEELLKTKMRSQRMHAVTVVFSAVLASLVLTLFVTITRALLVSNQPGTHSEVYLRIRGIFLDFAATTVPVGFALGLLMVLLRYMAESKRPEQMKKKE